MHNPEMFLGLKRLLNMKFVTLIKDYSKLSESNLDLKGGKIIAALTGNTDFPVTMPTLSDFMQVKNTYSTNLVAAANGDRAAIAMIKPG